VTKGISAPLHSGFYAGLGTAFSLGAAHKLAPGAVVQDITALHITVSHLGAGVPSISTQIAVLRGLLLGSTRSAWADVAAVSPSPSRPRPPSYSPMIVTGPGYARRQRGQRGRYRDADLAQGRGRAREGEHDATDNCRRRRGTHARGRTWSRARRRRAEPRPAVPVHLGAEADVCCYFVWMRKELIKRLPRLPGPPLTKHTAVTKLLEHNVTVGLGVLEAWDARNARFDVAWVRSRLPCYPPCSFAQPGRVRGRRPHREGAGPRAGIDKSRQASRRESGSHRIRRDARR
jgi:hypothetical protein